MQKAKRLGTKSIEPVYHWRYSVALAQLKAEKDRFEEAYAFLDDAAAVRSTLHLPDLQPIGAIKTRVRLRQGDLHKALDWVKDQSLSIEDELSFLQEYQHLTLVRVLLAQFQQDNSQAIIEQAIMFLSRLEDAARGGKRLGSLLEILLLQAIAYQAAGDNRAIDILQTALALAEPQNCVRPFVTEGSPIARLLKQIVSQ